MILATAVIGCGRAPMVVKDPVLQPVIDRFMAEAAARGAHPITEGLTISVGRTTIAADRSKNGAASELGVCIKGDGLDGDRVIFVAGDAELMNDPVQLEEVIFHELGHCALDLDHEEPKENHYTLMSPYLTDSGAYSDLRGKLLDHLFGVTNEQPSKPLHTNIGGGGYSSPAIFALRLFD